MSALGLTQTVLATQLIEAFRKDIANGIEPINLIGSGKIENGHTADWIRSVAKNIVDSRRLSPD